MVAARWVRIEIDVGGLGRMSRIYPLMDSQLRDMRPLWGAVIRGMEDRVRRTFAEEGPGWKPLAPLTQLERMRLGFPPAHPILVRTGLLKRSLTSPGAEGAIREVTPRMMRYGTSVPYAATHQFGTRRVPQRAMIQPRQLIPVISRAIEDQIPVAVRRAMRRA